MRLARYHQRKETSLTEAIVMESPSFSKSQEIDNRYLIFTIENEKYGIEINAVTEIVGTEGIREKEDLPYSLIGLLNMRGSDVPVMDLRLRFLKNPKAADAKASIIIVDLEDISIGLLVDGVSEVLTVAAENVIKLPRNSADPVSLFIKGIGTCGNMVILVIDYETLLTPDEIKAVCALL
jgi:purine-binding chemotaxis protein CheW